MLYNSQRKDIMFAITGITGQVGGAIGRTLLAKGCGVRAVVRDANKAGSWAKQGCEIAVADMYAAKSLETAFDHAEGVFVMLPAYFDPSPDFRESRAAIAAFRSALSEANPPKIVCLSTIGAQSTRPNLLGQLRILEQELSTLPMPITFLRPAWFMENFSWDIPPARETGVIPSFLQPLDKPFPMVATEDIGATVAELLLDSWVGLRVVELEGPTRVSPQQAAEIIGKLLGRQVRMATVPRDTWESLFLSQGVKNPTPRIQMLDGFNEGWIEFEGDPRKGGLTLKNVLASMINAEG
jgi:uncharacterized protein YbjT (DUF2867 family)